MKPSLLLAAIVSTVVLTSTTNAQAGSSVTLGPRTLDGFPGIVIPVVGGVPARIARPINLLLDRERQTALAAAEACRATAGRLPSRYVRKATATYNGRGLLSLRFAGDAVCGGAHGLALADARTFDLNTGRPIDVMRATGLSTAAIAKLAVSGYQGSADCRSFLRDRVGTADITPRAAYLVPEGVAVLFDFNVGAAQSCGTNPAVIPIVALRSVGRPTAPLNHL